MDCRPGCAACCISPSISSPLPGHPNGKAEGLRCPKLTADGLCSLHDGPFYPDVCRDFNPSKEFCGESTAEALQLLAALAAATRPAAKT